MARKEKTYIEGVKYATPIANRGMWTNIKVLKLSGLRQYNQTGCCSREPLDKRKRNDQQQGQTHQIKNGKCDPVGSQSKGLP